MLRKKPIGVDWTTFSTTWAHADHKGRIALAHEKGVSLDVAKHWISEGNTDPVTPPETRAMPPEDIRDEILSLPEKVQLDFVCLDIETNNLKADFGIILTCVIKPFGQAPITFRGDNYPSWWDCRDNDSAITHDIVKELCRHAIVITHYGRKFDVPFLRAKMSRYGLPNLPPMFGIDTWRIAKDNYCVGSRRLEALSNYFQFGAKSAVEGGLWNKAVLAGDPTAMDAIVAHNIQDTVLLEKLASVCFPFLKAIPRL